MRLVLCTRFVHNRAYSTDQTRKNCLSLLRTTAQSVSVITTVLPTPAGDTDQSPVYHGATLSSFTSVAMYPQPLVSFSLRTPSRMVESLRESSKQLQTSLEPHMVINLLCASQAKLALHFSRPHEFPNPFASTSYILSEEGVPILHDCLGALSCSLVWSSPLGGPSPTASQHSSGETVSEGIHEGQGSELFIAKVLRVEEPAGGPLDSEGRQRSVYPLVYYRQRYVTVDNSTCLLSLHQRTP